MPLQFAQVSAEVRLAVLATGQDCACGASGRCSPLHFSHGPVCEVRLHMVRRYETGVQKLGTAPRQVELFGRRGKPIKKMRLISAEKAIVFARKLQGSPGCTVSVC
jgi:hypothetical protein